MASPICPTIDQMATIKALSALLIITLFSFWIWQPRGGHPTSPETGCVPQESPCCFHEQNSRETQGIIFCELGVSEMLLGQEDTTVD